MPGYDQTGPMGQGPMTGWGMGLCARNVNDPAPAPTAGFGRGRRGMGRGFGRGMGRGFGPAYGRGFDGANVGPAQPEPTRSRDDLRQEMADLESRLNALKQELNAGD